MKTSSENKLNLKLFYKELGRLLYAVAYSDGKIRKQEVEALNNFIYKELLPIEFSSDSSGMNQAFYTEFEFDELIKENLPPQLVFHNYITYLKANAPFITNQHKLSIISSVEKVANAYKHINKKEDDIIELLKEEIKHL
jgi:hypothetical protein